MLTDPGAVPRGNATKENIEAMGLKAGEVRMKLLQSDLHSTYVEFVMTSLSAISIPSLNQSLFRVLIGC